MIDGGEQGVPGESGVEKRGEGEQEVGYIKGSVARAYAPHHPKGFRGPACDR